MGVCCSDVSSAPDVILPDPIIGDGYEVSIEYIGRGDTYELWTKHPEHEEGMKWLNIRRYKKGAALPDGLVYCSKLSAFPRQVWSMARSNTSWRITTARKEKTRAKSWRMLL